MGAAPRNGIRIALRHKGRWAARERGLAAERERRPHARGAGRTVDDEGRGAGAGDDPSNDLHPFVAFNLRAIEGAPRFSPEVDAGGEVAVAATAERVQGRRLSLAPGAQRQRRRGGRERSRHLRALPPRDHTHRPLGLRRLDPHVVPLAGEIDRPGEGALAQRPRRTRAPFRRLGRAQRPGGREGDVDQAQATEPSFQTLLRDLAPHLIADQLTLAPELERHLPVVRGLELCVQTVARLQSEFDVDDRSRFRARGRCRGGNEQEGDRGCRGEE
jgi:hypothetical protein